MGFNGVTNMPHWQGSFPISADIGNHRVRLTPRYRDSMNTAYDDLSDDQRVGFNHNEGQWLLNVNWSYQFNQGSNVAFTVSNLFATDPTAAGRRPFRPAAQGTRPAIQAFIRKSVVCTSAWH